MSVAIPDRTVRHAIHGEAVLRAALLSMYAAFLALSVLYPMLQVALRSVQDGQGRFVGAANYLRYFSTPAIAASITNSLAVAASTTLLTVILSFVYAYALTRTTMPLRGVFRLVIMLPIFAPSLVQGIAFIYVFGNNGLVTRWTGVNVGIYGFKGILLAETFYALPHAVLILVAALGAADARLYDAASALGASRTKTFFTVTLPGVKYGLMSACFVVFTLVITDFGVPKVIGGKYSVMATEIYNQVIGQQNFTMGATVSVVLLIPAAVAMVVDRLVQRRQYALLTASSVPLRPQPHGARDAALVAYCGLVAGGIATIYLVILASSLATRWPYNFALTTKHYRFDTVGGYTALVNSLEAAALAAVGGTVLAFAGAYLVEKCRTVASGPLYVLSVLPVSVPGMVLGLAYIFTFNAPGSPLNALYGTLAILVISHLVHYFTVPFLSATAALKQMDPEFERVSASLGVPFYRTMWRVTVPVALPQIVALSMYFFLNAMVTLSAAVFLVAPGTELAAVAVLLMDDAGDTAQAAAMSVLIIAIGLGVRLLYAWLMRGVTRRTQAWQREPQAGLRPRRAVRWFGKSR
jgi:iron(III) transport system permease protein